MKYRKLPCEFTEMAKGGKDSALHVRPVPVTACISNLNSEKPTSKWSFLMKLEPDFNLMMIKLKVNRGVMALSTRFLVTLCVLSVFLVFLLQKTN